MIKNKGFWIAGLLIFLVLLLVLALKLNETEREMQNALLEAAEILLIFDDKQEYISRELLLTLPTDSFEAVLDTASTSATTHWYKGVQMKKLLSYYDIVLEQDAILVVTGADGFSVAYGRNEVMEEGAVFITYEEDGEALKTHEQGGRGPFESIVVSDAFSNRRCKWVTQIEVKR